MLNYEKKCKDAGRTAVENVSMTPEDWEKGLTFDCVFKSPLTVEKPFSL